MQEYGSCADAGELPKINTEPVTTTVANTAEKNFFMPSAVLSFAIREFPLWLMDRSHLGQSRA